MKENDTAIELGAAIRSLDPAAVSARLGAGADPNAVVEPDGRTALAVAIEIGGADLIRLLIASGADPNRVFSYRAISPVAHAASLGQASILASLLDQGAQPDAPDASGNTPLHAGARFAPIVRILLEAGCNVNARGADESTPLMAASGRDPEGNSSEEAVRLLLAWGADVHARTRHGMRALGAAALVGRARALRVLVEGGAEVNAPDYRDQSALALLRDQQARLRQPARIAIPEVTVDLVRRRRHFREAERFLVSVGARV